MSHYLVRLTFACLLLGSLHVRSADDDLSPFGAGDVWVAIGDSITHSRRYHGFLYLFFATRYPEKHFKMYNCGVSGDSAGGAVRRFDWDIAVHKPTVATIMLGMNDVGRGNYAPGRIGDEVEARRQQAIDGHVRNMDALSAKLSGIGCRIIYITPSIYDDTGELSAANCAGVNRALGVCGKRVAELAPTYGAAVVDLHTPMTALNAVYQKDDRSRTIVGPDRVHPGDAGQFVMAYLILKGMRVSGTVSAMTVDAGAGKAVRSENCQITTVQSTPSGVRFTSLERALPFPVHPVAREALDLIPFMTELNREELVVTGLVEGEYALLIDGAVVGRYTAGELAVGVNLAENQQTPMFKQALRIMEVNERRHAIPASKLRTFAAQKHFLRDQNVDPDDYDAMKSYLLQRVEQLRQSKHSLYGYMRGQADAYIRYKPQEGELVAAMEQAMADMWQENAPVPHTFEVKPMSAELMAELTRVIVDEFDEFSGWNEIGWSNVKAEVTCSNGIVKISAPRTNGHRDMLGYSKRLGGVAEGTHVLKVRLRAPKGSHFGVEVVVNKKLERVMSYVPTSGEWQTLTGAPVKGVVSSLSLLLAEPSEKAAWPSESTSYEIDSVWFE